MRGGLFFCLSVVVCFGLSLYHQNFKPLSIAYLLGLLLVLIAANTQKQQQLTDLEHRILTAVIIDLPVKTPQKTTFTVETNNHEKFLVSHYSAFLNTQKKTSIPDYQPGDQYLFELRLKPPHGTANGVGFDRERWLFRHGIDGIGTIQQAKQVNALNSDLITSLRLKLNGWRYHLSHVLNRHFPDQRSNALLHALSIGDKSRFESQDHQLFQATGTAHLIAISGLHIGMVAAIGAGFGWFIYWLFPQQRLPRPLLQIICGLSLATMYAGLAGFSVSTQRALIMLAVYGWYKWRRRSAYAWDVWSISLLLVLLIDPLNVLDSGFWLSFWAVAVLIFAFQGRTSHHAKWLDFIKIQWLLLIGMMPLSLLHFGSLKIWAPLVNLIVIPVMTFLFIPALLIMMLVSSLTGYIPEILVHAINLISDLFWSFLDQFSQLDTNALSGSIQGFWPFALLTLAAIILLLPKAIPQRHWGLLLILIALWPNTTQLKTGQFKAEILDVGQGTSVLISTQNHHLLYDVGARFPSGFNFADAVIIPLLNLNRINTIDTLILSHKDNDHAGAFPELAEDIYIGQILSTDGRFKHCVAGQNWVWDNVSFEIISPYNIEPYLKNNSSCVIKISSSHTSILLTGDIEQAVEYRLTQHHPTKIQSNILLIPHHGSNTSSGSEFIATVNPHLAINSSGAYNQFNHPTEQVKANYENLKIPIIDTQTSGRITLITPKNKTDSFKTFQFRHQNPRIWRR